LYPLTEQGNFLLIIPRIATMPFERGLAEISSVPALLNSESPATDAKQQD